MTLASTLITEAFTKATVKPSQTPLTAYQNADGLRNVNDLVAEWNAVGLLNNCSPVNTTAGDIGEDRHEKPAIVSELAKRLCSEYGIPIPQNLLNEAADTFSSMAAVNNGNLKPTWPSRLPLGQANEDDAYINDTFYEVTDEENF